MGFARFSFCVTQCTLSESSPAKIFETFSLLTKAFNIHTESSTMQAGYQPYRATQPSGAQIREMFELSSWLDDIFKTETPVHRPTMADFDDKPEMFLSSRNDGVDHQVGIITSSPTVSLDCLDTVRLVSPSPSPSAHNINATLPENNSTFQLHQRPQAGVSMLSTKRKHLSDSSHLVSDSSDNEDASQRNQKRQRKAPHTTRAKITVSVPVVSKTKSVFVPKPSPSATKKKVADLAIKKQIRREKNREHAKKSRSKKRDYNNALEESVVALRQENKKLRELVYGRFGETEAKSMVRERIRTPEDKMIEDLKKPANKVLSQSVIHYLQSLRHDIKLNSTR